jgi:translation initiation factor 1
LTSFTLGGKKTFMSKKPKISVEASRTGLNNPFANLEGAGLPAEGTGLPEGPVPISPEIPHVLSNERSQAKGSAPKSLGRVVLRREKAARGGKTVVVIYDFPPTIHNAAIEELARTLRKECGCGGTIRDRTIEIQGDQVPKIRARLEEKGFRVAGVS